MPPVRPHHHNHSVARGNEQTEREMTTSERSLVDSFFEEHHYEAGIVTLDQLRSSSSMPSPDHIRQLLYIILRSPSIEPQGNDKIAQGANTDPPKQQSHLPSSADVAAAQRCLQAFGETNSPQSLLRAIPSYDESHGSLSDGANVVEDEEESFLYKEAKRIQSCKSCWQLLRADLLGPIGDRASIPIDGRTKHRTRNSGQSDDDIWSTAVVGPTAWPVLEWLVILFEKDEENTAASGQSRYSPCLLSHIPPPRTKTRGKEDFSAPLDVVFYCLSQEDRYLRSLGSRLIRLVINLTSTSLVDMHMLVQLIRARVIAESFDLSRLLSALDGDITTVRAFKIALCSTYLSDSPSRTTRSGRGRARANPRRVPKRNGATTDGKGDDVTSVAEISPAPATDAPSLSRGYELPPASSIIELVTRPSIPEDTSNFRTAKIELICDYSILQQTLDNPERNEWVEMLRDGKVMSAVEDSFRDDTSGIIEQLQDIWSSTLSTR